MSDVDALFEYWRAHDTLFERVEQTWWGAVVSDARYPLIQEPNYARVETGRPVELEEIEEALSPAMDRSGSVRSHVVIFRPHDQTDLVAQASSRGIRVTWDLVMASLGAPSTVAAGEEVASFDDAFWAAHRASARVFDLTEDATLDQLQAMERDTLLPAGRRWFVVREAGRTSALAALLVLEGVGYLDHVVTFPEARRRGHAEALTRLAAAEASRAGATRTFLLADPEGAAVRLYERIPFARVGHLASWIAPLERRRLGRYTGGAGR